MKRQEKRLRADETMKEGMALEKSMISRILVKTKVTFENKENPLTNLLSVEYHNFCLCF